MNFYQNLGYLVLGSRFRRLSEAFLSEINCAYQNEGIDFDASWFPVFYLLSKSESLSIKELSEQIEISHPAASQLVSGLKNKNLVITTTCAGDGRRQLVQFTDSGRKLLLKVVPVWDALSIAMQELADREPGFAGILPVITLLENSFRDADLASMITEKLALTVKAGA